MIDSSRRTVLTTGAAAAAATTAPRVFAQAPQATVPQGLPAGLKIGFYEKGNVRIRYAEIGSGFPLLATPGGGLNSCIAVWSRAVINIPEEFKNDFRVITMDQRNATGGESTGPVPVDDPWSAFADDQLGDNAGRDVWAKELRERRPDVSTETIEKYLHNLYRVQPDFVYSVSRDFAKSCQTPMIVLPDDVVAHPLQTSIDVASLCPNAEITVFPWKEPPELKVRTINRARTFLKRHQTA
jgi:hypothetical protein